MKKENIAALVMGIIFLALAIWGFMTGHEVWGSIGLFYGLLCTGVGLFKRSKSEPSKSEARDLKPEMRVIDFRPDWEIQMEHEVQSDLGGEDEQYARQLCTFLAQHDQGAARKIGEELYAKGGHRRMVRVCLRVKALGGAASTLERRVWDGIGEWRG